MCVIMKFVMDYDSEIVGLRRSKIEFPFVTAMKWTLVYNFLLRPSRWPTL